jgi:lipopolysaccharide biosynthesis glycosyltransferase
VPWICGYQGWAIFMDADILCQGDINELWELRDERYAVQVVQHNHNCASGLKFQGMPQSPYQRKNWSSVMLFNCARCKALSPHYVNTASGLELHQFGWTKTEEIGALPPQWNVLVGVQEVPDDARLLHYTLGGPWFEDCRSMPKSDLWEKARQELNHPLEI